MASETPSEVLGQFYVRGADGSSWPGILTFGRRASLRLLIVSPEIGDGVPAPLAAALDGKQVDIVGESNARGCITLLRCAHTKQRSSNHYFRGVQTTELTFQPTEIWAGPRPFERDDSFTQLTLGFSGIHGIIGTKPLVRKSLVKPEEKRAIEASWEIRSRSFITTHRRNITLSHWMIRLPMSLSDRDIRPRFRGRKGTRYRRMTNASLYHARRLPARR
jgi:hypothetical protein